MRPVARSQPSHGHSPLTPALGPRRHGGRLEARDGRCGVGIGAQVQARFLTESVSGSVVGGGVGGDRADDQTDGLQAVGGFEAGVTEGAEFAHDLRAEARGVGNGKGKWDKGVEKRGGKGWAGGEEEERRGEV